MVYLDNNATTPLHPEVKRKITEAMELYGNPSSAHGSGRQTKMMIDAARQSVADFLNCKPEEIIFTASGSEANNTVLKSFVGCGNCNCSVGKSHIITSSIEHPSVLNTLQCLGQQDVDVTYLPVDEFGLINLQELEEAIRPSTKLISIMYGNNEIGTIQPIEEIAKIAKTHGIPFHTDAVQAVGKVPIDLETLEVDFMSLSGHKIYAPKGIGILYKRNNSGFSICPLITGGHQETSLRAGTENTLGIAAIGEAFTQLSKEMDQEIIHIKKLRDRMEAGIMEHIPNVKLNGHPEKRLPGTLNVSFNNIEGESILLRLDMHGVSVSTGSACSSGSLDPSPVIMALGVDPEVAHSSVRISFGRENTDEDVDKALDALVETVSFLRKISPIR